MDNQTVITATSPAPATDDQAPRLWWLYLARSPRHALRAVLAGLVRFVAAQGAWRRAAPIPVSWLRGVLLLVELVAVLGAEVLIFQSAWWVQVAAVAGVVIAFGQLGLAVKSQTQPAEPTP